MNLLEATHRIQTEHFAHRRRKHSDGPKYMAREIINQFGACRDLATITTDDLRTWFNECIAKGNTPGTILSKRSFVSVLFKHFKVPCPEFPRIEKPQRLKWWLTPEMEVKVRKWLNEQRLFEMDDWVRWTVLTGLRIEETLRVERQHFTGLQRPYTAAVLLVPGTKTDDAQASIPLFAEAAELALSRFQYQHETERLFPHSYRWYAKQWRTVRKALGIPQTHMTTLKAMRRSFARLCTDKGLPPDMLRQCLRHADLKTTTGYLALVGGYHTEQMRQWIK